MDGTTHWNGGTLSILSRQDDIDSGDLVGSGISRTVPAPAGMREVNVIGFFA